MPIIWTGIVPLLAKVDCTFVLAKDKGSLATVMKLYGIAVAQLNPVMRLIEFFNNFRPRVDLAYSLNKIPSS